MKVKPLPFILYGIVIFLWDCMSILSAICLQKMFDAFGAMNQVSKSIYFIVVALVLVYVLRGLTSFVVMAMECWGGFSVDAFLKLNTMERIFEAYGAKFPEKSNGEILNVFRNDIDEIKSFLLQMTEEMALCVYFFAIVMVLFHINPFILSVVLTISVLSVFVIRAGFKKLSECRKKVRKMDGTVNGFAGEILDAVLAVKMAGAEESVLSYFERLGQKRENVSIRQNVFRQFINSVNQFSFEIGEGVILLLAFRMIREGSFSIGDFALFTFLFDSISSVVSSTAQVVSELPQVEIAVERLESMIGEYCNCTREQKYEEEEIKVYIEQIYQNREINEKSQKTTKNMQLEIFEVKNLDCYAKDGQEILNKISFTLKRGTITVISGKTASGKTMLLRTVLGLYPTPNGVLLLNGKQVMNPEVDLLPPLVAYTPQNPSLFSESIRDNILKKADGEKTLDQMDAKLEKAIYMAVLEDDIKQFEQGVDTVLGVKGTKVSGGQRKRIALARMFAREAELYVMDDVSNALDIETEKKLWERVKKQQDKTVLIASNSRYALEIADQIIFLENGSIEVYGKLEEALKQSQNIRQMVGSGLV